MISLEAAYRFGLGQAGVGLLRRGWASPEPNFVWSVGAESTLEMPGAGGDGDVVLELTIEPFLAPPSLRYQHAGLSVNGEDFGVRRLGGRFTWCIALPRADAFSMALTRPHHAPAPSELGLPDGRDLAFKLLGLNVLRRRAWELPPSRRPLAVYRFGWNDETEALLVSGWGLPEDGYVWAVGRTSLVRLPLRGMAGPALLLLDMRPFGSPGYARQRIAIGADGRLLRYIDLRQRMVVALPIQAMPGASQIEVQFDHLDAGAAEPGPPYGAERQLAWALASARIAPVPARVAPARLSRLPGRWQDGTLAKAVPAHIGMSVADLVTRFESLAGSCRLGNLQRRLERDQVGLLRYAALHQHEMVEAILAGFAGIGRQDALKWDVRGPQDTTWRLIDLVYQISFATPYPLAGEPPAEGFAKFGRLLPWLAGKLMRDIAGAEKIFVVRLPDADDEAAALAVLVALRHFGDAQLLMIDDDGRTPAGSVEWLESGVLRGHLDATEDVDLDNADAALVSVLANAWALLHPRLEPAPDPGQNRPPKR